MDQNKDSFSENKCIYRHRSADGRIHCERRSINESIDDAGAYFGTRYTGACKNTLRPVAFCDVTSNHTSTDKMVNHRLELLIKQDRSRKAVAFDARLAHAEGVRFKQRGNPGQTWLSFIADSGLSARWTSTTFYLKESWSEMNHKRLVDTNATIMNWYDSQDNIQTFNSVSETICPYEVYPENASGNFNPDDKAGCIMKRCNIAPASNEAPVLSCNAYRRIENGQKEELRYILSVGFLDNELKSDAGLTIRDINTLKEVGLSSRVGPENTSARTWLNSNQVEFQQVHVFDEPEITHFVRIADNFSPFGKRASALGTISQNKCLYEKLVRDDANEINDGSLINCFPSACESVPNYNSATERIRPVAYCKTTFSSSDEEQLRYRAKYRYSLHLEGNSISSKKPNN